MGHCPLQKNSSQYHLPFSIEKNSSPFHENNLQFLRKLLRLILRTMIKCHCAEVFFENILSVVKETNRPILEVAREMGAADTCTACVPDMVAFIEREMEGLSLAGNSNYR